MKTITFKQTQVLHAIANYILDNGYAPTMKELAEVMEYASPNAAQNHVEALRKKEYLTLKSNQARSIVLTVKALKLIDKE